jgi:DNA polymerase I-like protein with 3'-5' exonuclease and polymerase domains
MKLVFDIEANALSEVNIGKNVSTEVSRIWCLVAQDMDTGEVFEYLEEDIEEGVKLLRNATQLIGHNITMYDIPVLERFYGPIDTMLIDTLIISKLMYPDRRSHPFGGNSLKNWGYHLGELKDDYMGGFDVFTDEMLSYCKQDVRVSTAIWNAQKEFVSGNKQLVKLEHKVTRILAQQIENGMGFDRDAADRLEQEILMEKASIDDVLSQEFEPIVTERWSDKTGKRLKDSIEYFNSSSRQQIAKRLKIKYGWVAPLTDKGNPKVDEKVLKGIPYPEASMLARGFDIEKMNSMLSDWITRANVSRDNNIHGSVNPQGAVTGRMTASQPNLQQVTGDPRARALFIPTTKGRVQVGIDASGLEARLLANRMAKWDDGEYGDLVINGDIHTHNQKQAGLTNRDDAKTFFYALIYGAGAGKIGEIIGKGIGAGASLKKRFLDNMPALKKLIENCEFQVADKGTVTLLDNREVPCRSKHSSLNVQIQGDGAVLMKYALCYLIKDLDEAYPERYALMATVHDEWQLECDATIAKAVGFIGVRAIKKAGRFLNCAVPMDGEYRIGKNWSECH